MNPIAGERFSSGRFGLSHFIFMVGESEVSAATMDVKGFSQIFLAHDGTFDVPAWSSFPPGTFPEGFSRFTGFPKSEVKGIFFLFININSGTGLHILQIPFGEFSIIFKFLHGEEDISTARVSKSFLNEG